MNTPLNEHRVRFFLASNNDAESQHDQCEVLRVLQTSPERVEQIADYFYTKTCELIKIKSYLLSDKNIKFVDIVRDVLRYVPLHWAATELVRQFEMLRCMQGTADCQPDRLV
jgi:linoleate 10R-lipoxygenase